MLGPYCRALIGSQSMWHCLPFHFWQKKCELFPVFFMCLRNNSHIRGWYWQCHGLLCAHLGPTGPRGPPWHASRMSVAMSNQPAWAAPAFWGKAAQWPSASHDCDIICFQHSKFPASRNKATSTPSPPFYAVVTAMPWNASAIFCCAAVAASSIHHYNNNRHCVLEHKQNCVGKCVWALISQQAQQWTPEEINHAARQVGKMAS